VPSMRIALVLPGRGSINLGNEMICEATRRIVRRLANNLEVVESTFLKRPSFQEFQRINSCDKAIFVGTNIFQRHAVGWKWRTEDLERIEVPYFLYGIGYSGPLQGETGEICDETRDLVDWCRKADGVGVRDPQTVRWLEHFGVRCELVGCPVLAYADSSTGIALGEGKPVLAIRRMLLHDPGPETIAAQRSMVDWFFKEYPEGICIMQERPDLSLLRGRSVVTDFSKVVSVLSQARFVLSSRLHAGMIALALGRPAVFLAHDTRVDSFCEMVRLRSRMLNYEGVEEAALAIRRIERGDLAEFDLATVRLPFFRRRLESFLSDAIMKVTASNVSRGKIRRRKISRIRSGLRELLQEAIAIRYR